LPDEEPPPLLLVLPLLDPPPLLDAPPSDAGLSGSSAPYVEHATTSATAALDISIDRRAFTTSW